MPELPEVETIARALRNGGRSLEGRPSETPSILGMTIERAELIWDRTLAQPGKSEFLERITGQTIWEVGRRGKFLLQKMSRDWLIFHLRMSGDLTLEPADAPLAPHDHLLIWFTGAWRLAFNDARKFGRAWLVSEPQEVLEKLGPEPLEDGFSPDWLFEQFQQRKRLLKPLLLDQTFIAGIGNIYADEALFAARLHPLAASNRVSRSQAAALWGAIRAVLQAGISRQGASIDWVYRGGNFQNEFQVYQKTGQPCPACGGPIQRIQVGQRSTHFCPHCQALP